MTISPHHITALRLPSQSPTFAGDCLEFSSQLQSPFLFSESSVPRGMAQFRGFEKPEVTEMDNELSNNQGNYLTGVHSGVTYIPDFANYSYHPPPQSDVEPYWTGYPQENDIPTRAMNQPYLQPHSSASSTYSAIPWGDSSTPLNQPSPQSAGPSNYNYASHSPQGSPLALIPHSAGGYRRSRSSERAISTYANSAHVATPPVTPRLTFGTSPIHEATPNPDGHREQLRLFRDATQLPMSFNAGPFVPQKMYIPHTNSDVKRYVHEVDLQAPIYFWMDSPVECGIPLIDALHSRVRRLQNRDEPVFEGRGPSISIRIAWPGYRPWSRQIPTKDFRSPPQPITRAKLVKNIAKCVDRFLAARSQQVMDDDVDIRWKLGHRPNEIKLDDLILVSVHHVSMGSWQPQLRLRRPFPS